MEFDLLKADASSAAAGESQKPVQTALTEHQKTLQPLWDKERKEAETNGKLFQDIIREVSEGSPQSYTLFRELLDMPKEKRECFFRITEAFKFFATEDLEEEVEDFIRYCHAKNLLLDTSLIS